MLTKESRSEAGEGEKLMSRQREVVVVVFHRYRFDSRAVEEEGRMQELKVDAFEGLMDRGLPLKRMKRERNQMGRRRDQTSRSRGEKGLRLSSRMGSGSS